MRAKLLCRAIRRPGGRFEQAEDLAIAWRPPIEQMRDDTLYHATGITFFRSEEHTSELQSLMRISYAVFCLKKKTTTDTPLHTPAHTLQHIPTYLYQYPPVSK